METNCALLIADIQLCFMLNERFTLLQQWTVHRYGLSFSKRPPTRGMAVRALRGISHLTVRLVSLSSSLPLSVRHCSASLHMPRQTGREPRQVWAHRLQSASQTQSCTPASCVQLMDNILIQGGEKNQLPWWQVKNSACRIIRINPETIFFSLKVTVPLTNCSLKHEHSHCSFVTPVFSPKCHFYLLALSFLISAFMF